MRARILVALVVLATLSTEPRVLAGDDVAPMEDARSTALTLAREGAQLYEAGDFHAALDKFEQAYARFPSPKLLFNLGQARRALSRHAEALADFERFLSEAKDAAVDYREQAAIQIAELQTKVTRVAIACNRPGAEVRIDGEKKGTLPLAKPLPVEVGAHRLDLVWKEETRTVEFTAVAGQVLPLTLSFEERAAPAETPPTPRESASSLQATLERPEPPAPPAPSRKAMWYWIAGGAVVAAVATTLILIYTAKDKYPTADLGQGTIGDP